MSKMLRGIMKQSTSVLKRGVTVNAASATLQGYSPACLFPSDKGQNHVTTWRRASMWQQVRGMSVAMAGVVDTDGNRPALQITERCAKRILKVQPDGFLRIRVDGGGCSGFQYKFELDTAKEDDDVLFEKDGAKLVIDQVSLDMVRGSKVDFVEEMISSSFRIVGNPNSESACGCGSSFSPKTT